MHWPPKPFAPSIPIPHGGDLESGRTRQIIQSLEEQQRALAELIDILTPYSERSVVDVEEQRKLQVLGLDLRGAEVGEGTHPFQVTYNEEDNLATVSNGTICFDRYGNLNPPDTGTPLPTWVEPIWSSAGGHGIGFGAENAHTPGGTLEIMQVTPTGEARAFSEGTITFNECYIGWDLSGHSENTPALPVLHYSIDFNNWWVEQDPYALRDGIQFFPVATIASGEVTQHLHYNPILPTHAFTTMSQGDGLTD